MRIGVWLRANPIDPTATGDYLFQTVSQEHGLAELWGKGSIFDSDGPALKQFQRLNLPGWMRGGSTPLYDDVYVATGANAIAHVEITDSANYSQAHAVAVQPSKSWSDNTITVDLNAAGISDINNAYLFVWDRDGNRNSTGFPLGNAVAPPKYPSNIL
jgi:hypothetical protein